MKLANLSEEQKALMPVIRDKWIDMALHDDTPVDSDKFREGIAFIYGLAKLPEPGILIVDSPLGVQLAHNLLRKFPGVDDSVYESADESVQASVRDSVQTSVEASVQASVRDSVQASVWDSVQASVWDSVWASVQASVRDSVQASVRDSVQASVRDSVRASVQASVRDSVRVSVQASVRVSVQASVYESVLSFQPFAYTDLMWCSWASFYDYFSQIGVLKNENFEACKLYLEAGGTFTVLFKGIAITSNRPLFVRQDDQKRLHCESGPAIKWRDGFELYFLDGVELTQKMHQSVISKKITFGEMMAIDNADIRAVALKYNSEAIIDSGAEMIDKSERGNELFLIERTELNDFLAEPEIYFLKMKCPTGRVFVEGVDPTIARKHPNADYLQAYALGINLEQYQVLRNEG